VRASISDIEERIEDWSTLKPELVIGQLKEIQASLAYDSSDSIKKEINVVNGLNLHEAEVLALYFNQKLRSLRLSKGLSRIKVKASRLWKDPNVDLNVEEDGSSKRFVDRWFSGLSLTIPLSGRRKIEAELARGELKHAELNVLAAEWATIIKLRSVWAQRLKFLRVLEVAKETTSELKLLLEWTPFLKKMGEMNVVEERELKLDLLKAGDDLLLAKAKVEHEESELMSILGLPEKHWYFEEVKDLYEPPKAWKPLERWERALDTPELLVFLQSYEQMKLQLNLELKRRIPDLNIGIGAGRENGLSLMGLGVGLTSLPLFNGRWKEISKANLMIEIKKEDVFAALQDWMRRRDTLLDHRSHLLERLKRLDEEWYPQADLQIEDVKRLARLGQMDFMLLVESMEKRRDIKKVRMEIYEHLEDLSLQWQSLGRPDLWLGVGQ
jgi:outer membrane protein TolC